MGFMSYKIKRHTLFRWELYFSFTPTGQGPIIAQIACRTRAPGILDQFLKKTTVTSLELDNKILSLHILKKSNKNQ